MVANSDTLLAPAYLQNLLHHPETVRSFQLPRVPSFVPDLALYTLVSALAPTWRHAAWAYGILSYVALVLVAGAVVARLAGRSWAGGCAVLLAVSVTALLVESDREHGAGSLFAIFIPLNHSGSFTLSLAGLLLARAALPAARPRLLALLAATAALGVLSDKLIIGSFVLPLAAAAQAWRIPGRRRPALLVTAAALAGSALGLLLDRALFASVLVRQADLGIDLALQWRLAPEMLRQPNLWVGAVCALAVTTIPATWRGRDRETAFWWAAAATTAAGFMGLLPLLYADVSAARYIQPVRWWAVILVAASLLRAAPRGAVWGAGALAIVTAALMPARGHDLLQPSKFLAYRPPTAACIRALHDAGTLHAGIAKYWDARVIAAATDWHVQLDQVVNGGEVFVWGNNPLYYTRDEFDPARPAILDFIVLNGFNPDDLAARFGAPARVLPCPGSDIWLYATPGGIAHQIGSIDLANERAGILAHAACFNPLDFSTRAGLLRPAGVTMPPTAPPHDIGTYGPYVRLRAGHWTLRLAYRLSPVAPNRSGPEDWDIAIDGGRTILQSGPLSPGATVQDIDLTVPNDTAPLELRTYLQPGDHLQLDSLTISPAGTPLKSCTP